MEPPPAPSPDAVARALSAAGLAAKGFDGEGAPTLFAEVRARWLGDRFELASREDVALPTLSGEAVMEIQLEARALARKWQAAWKGGVGAQLVRVAYAAEVPFAAGEPPGTAGALLQEAMARVHVAHVLLRQRAAQIAQAHAQRGPRSP